MVAGTARESPARLWLLRLAVGIVASFIALMSTVNVLGLWTFLPSIVVGAATAWTANGRRLLQIGAEIADLSVQSLPNSVRFSNSETLSAAEILPGDWVCRFVRYRIILEYAERKDSRKRELAERRRAASRQSNHDSNSDDRAVKEDPAIPLEQVIVIDKSSDNREIQLTFASGRKLNSPRDEMFYCRRLKGRKINTPAVHQDSQALGELLTTLARRSSTESDLIQNLAKSYPYASIHRALRAAISQRMIEQEIGLGRVFQEACAIFSSRMDTGLRHRCTVSLSQAGEVWTRRAGGAESRKGDGQAAEARSAPGTINNLFIGSIFQGGSAQPADVSAYRSARGQGAGEEHPEAVQSQRSKVNHDESDGYKLAWSAGVSATGAALAALLLTGQAAWQRALFISLIFISGCAFVVLILAGLPELTSRWRRLFRALLKRDTAHNPDPSDRGTN
jgi:hypothetical protein